MPSNPEPIPLFIFRSTEHLLRRYPKTASSIAFAYVTVAAYAMVDTARRGHVIERFIASIHYSAISLAIALIAGTATTIPILLRYLRTDTEKRTSSPIFEIGSVDTTKLRRQVAELHSKLANLTIQSGSESAGKEVARLREEMTKDIYDRVRNELKKEIDLDVSKQNCQNIFVQDQLRLADQLSILRRRGNLNLVIGVTTTLGAILILVLTVYSVRAVQPHSPELIAYFIPRISTVVFVEVFSFFFLRLYKATLDEEKYYQREITSRSSLQIGFEAAVSLDKEGSLPKVMEALTFAKVQDPTSSSPENTPKYDLKEVGQLVEAASKVIATVAKAKGLSD